MRFIFISFSLIILYIIFAHNHKNYDPFYTLCNYEKKNMMTKCIVEKNIYNKTRLNQKNQYVNEIITSYDVYVNNKTIKYNIGTLSDKDLIKLENYNGGKHDCFWDGENKPTFHYNCFTIFDKIIFSLACMLSLFIILILATILSNMIDV